MVEKGRVATGLRHGMNVHPEKRTPGELNGNAVLTWERVRVLRALKQSGASYRGLSREFGVSDTTVRRIVLGRMWREPALSG